MVNVCLLSLKLMLAAKEKPAGAPAHERQKQKKGQTRDRYVTTCADPWVLCAKFTTDDYHCMVQYIIKPDEEDSHIEVRGTT
jgi:hypothetical protein